MRHGDDARGPIAAEARDDPQARHLEQEEQHERRPEDRRLAVDGEEQDDEQSRMHADDDGIVASAQLVAALRFETCRIAARQEERSEEHTSELPSLMRISYAVFCLKKQTRSRKHKTNEATD